MSIVLFSRSNHLPVNRFQWVYKNDFPWKSSSNNTIKANEPTNWTDCGDVRRSACVLTVVTIINKYKHMRAGKGDVAEWKNRSALWALQTSGKCVYAGCVLPLCFVLTIQKHGANVMCHWLQHRGKGVRLFSFPPWEIKSSSPRVHPCMTRELEVLWIVNNQVVLNTPHINAELDSRLKTYLCWKQRCPADSEMC